MVNAAFILQLYDGVMENEIVENNTTEEDIRVAVRVMANLYAGESESLQRENVTVPDYNFASHRVAYLHKYAAFHTALVHDMMFVILAERGYLFKKIVTSGNFRLCCLGGGPGSDAVGVLTALNSEFGSFKTNVTIVDIMKNWEFTFESLINQLQCNSYSPLSKLSQQQCLDWNYIQGNLLGTMSNTVNKAIATANFITMVKFVSATACQDTEPMIKKIFNVMKPKAYVLFIDNAAGGFHEVIKRAACECGLVSIFGPLRHFKYLNEDMNVLRFGYQSCHMTTVTVHLFQKQWNRGKDLPAQQDSRGVTNELPMLNEEIYSIDNDLLNFNPSATDSNSTFFQNFNSNVNIYSANTNPAIHGQPSSSRNYPTWSKNFNRNKRSNSKSNAVRVQKKAANTNRAHRNYPVSARTRHSTVSEEYSDSSNVSQSGLIEESNEDDTDCSCCVIS